MTERLGPRPRPPKDQQTAATPCRRASDPRSGPDLPCHRRGVIDAAKTDPSTTTERRTRRNGPRSTIHATDNRDNCRSRPRISEFRPKGRCDRRHREEKSCTAVHERFPSRRMTRPASPPRPQSTSGPDGAGRRRDGGDDDGRMRYFEPDCRAAPSWSNRRYRPDGFRPGHHPHRDDTSAMGWSPRATNPARCAAPDRSAAEFGQSDLHCQGLNTDADDGSRVEPAKGEDLEEDRHDAGEQADSSPRLKPSQADQAEQDRQDP